MRSWKFGGFRCLVLGTVLATADRAVTAQDRVIVVAESAVGDRSGVRLSLHGGDYEIRQSPDRVLRVTETRPGADASGGALRMTRAHVKAAGDRTEVEVDPPTGRDGPHVVIEVPACAVMDLRLTAGELRMNAVPCAETTVHVEAGELVAALGAPETYRTISASVTMGEVTANGLGASPGDEDHGGFFPSYRREGAGTRRFRAHVGMGELQLDR